jgi:filamentous hemagglutinin
LGDGGYEQRLIRETIYACTGKRFFEGTASDDDAEQKALGLALGVEFTAARIAALTQNIVWLVEKEDNGPKVLAPSTAHCQSGFGLPPHLAKIPPTLR